ncbi:MAG: ASCH domain-containing protein [Anaerolineales bacterium]
MPDDPRTLLFWRKFLATLPKDSDYRTRGFFAEKWGDNREMADELGSLIADGVKTAACSSVWEWEAEGRPLPEPGCLTIVLDGSGSPLCLIETIEVEIKPFSEVDERFAREEGEGDRSLKGWREAHWRYFTRILGAMGRDPSPDMLLVCERIRVIFKK